MGTPNLRNVNIENLVFVSVETVPELRSYDYLSPDMQRLWRQASSDMGLGDMTPQESYIQAAGRMAEFGRVAAIAVAVIRRHERDEENYLITSVYTSKDEAKLLSEFSGMIDNFFKNPAGHYVVGHAIRRIDMPFYAKRLIVNGVEMPSIFDPEGRRSLPASLIDTADYWAFSDLAAPRLSAELVARAVGVDTSAEDYDYGKAARLYHEEDNVEGLSQRAVRKVLTSAQLLLRFRTQETIPAERIISK